tara:strand:- start:1178 stop:1777 length:600 start_codon:yes stop_codon:yes gene_type:complete
MMPKKHPNFNTMKKLLLLLLSVFLLNGCSKEEEVVLEQLFEISLDGESFDPYERYSVVNTFGGELMGADGKLKKIFILYLQIDDGNPRLDRQHFALYCLDSDANDDGELLDIGTYTWEAPDSKYAGVEIPGDGEYIVWNEVVVQDAGQLGGAHSGLICLTAEGEFYNPYIQRTMTVSMKLENFPIGVDITATPYGYLLN